MSPTAVTPTATVVRLSHAFAAKRKADMPSSCEHAGELPPLVEGLPHAGAIDTQRGRYSGDPPLQARTERSRPVRQSTIELIRLHCRQ